MRRKLKPPLEGILFSPDETLRTVLTKMTLMKLGFAIAVDKHKRLIGILTDGDVRRALLKGMSLESPAGEIINRKPKVYPAGWSQEEYKRVMLNDRVFIAPIIDEKNKVVDYVSLYHILTNYSYSQPKSLSGKDFYKENGESEKGKVLITGGAGYIGSILCRKLLEKGYYVRVLDALFYGTQSIEEFLSHPRFELIVGNILHLEMLERAVFGVDYVIHLAAVVGDSASNLDYTTTININYFASKVLAEIAKSYKVKKFIFASSCSVYGKNTGENLLSEEDAVNPISLYAETRLRSEREILSLKDENFSPVVLRLATVYGISPRMRFDLVVNSLVAQAVIEKEITIWGADQWRPFIHVEDAAEAFISVMEAPVEKVSGEIFNVGNSKENFTIGEIGEMIKNIIGGVKLQYCKKTTDLRSYKVSCEKITICTGFQTKHTLRDGIKELKRALESGKYRDYKDPRYSNLQTLHRIFISNVSQRERSIEDE